MLKNVSNQASPKVLPTVLHPDGVNDVEHQNNSHARGSVLRLDDAKPPNSVVVDKFSSTVDASGLVKVYRIVSVLQNRNTKRSASFASTPVYQHTHPT